MLFRRASAIPILGHAPKVMSKERPDSVGAGVPRANRSVAAPEHGHQPQGADCLGYSASALGWSSSCTTAIGAASPER